MELLKTTKKLLSVALALSLITISSCAEEGDEEGTTPDNNQQTSSTNSGSSGQATKTDASGKIVYAPVAGKNGGQRTITSFSPPKTFNLYLAAEATSNDILGQMYEGLSYMDPFTKEVKPALAESWTISEDKTTYIVKMKKDLKWSDGHPITADDIVFTYNEVINNPDIPTNSRDGLLVDEKFPVVTKIDDHTVKFVTAKPFVPFFKNGGFGSPPLPKHIVGKLVKKDSSGKIPFNQWGSLNADPKSIVCNGPFRLKEYVAGQRVILEKNPYYWRKDKDGKQLPYIDQYITEIVKDQEVELIKFKAKESDSYFLRGGQDYEVLKPDETKLNFKITNLGPDDGTLFIIFNMSTAKDEKGNQIVDPVRSAWFKNVKFRKALSHAIDKESMVKSIYRNLATAQKSSISQQNPYYNPNVKDYEYDMKKAASMLEEAGFKKNDKNELLDSKGNKVEFSLYTNVGNSARDAACSMIRADWEKLGIKVNYKPIQFNTLVQKIDETLDWDAIMLGLTGSSIDPHGGINTWRLSGRMHMFNMGNPEQKKEWKGRETSYEPWEKEIYDLFDKASKEFDETKRKDLYNKAQEVTAENVPFLYTVNKFALVGARNNIGNVFPNLSGGNGLNTINWNSFEQYIQQ
ncbi:MAG: ABC transporter substrate-binding protein [Candidatus Sericytochromatia bacterium]